MMTRATLISSLVLTLAIAALAACAGSANAAIVSVDSATSSVGGSNFTIPAAMHRGELAATTGDFTSDTFTALTEANKNTLVSNSAFGFLGNGPGDGTTKVGSQFFTGVASLTVTFNFTNQTIGEILLWNYSQTADRGNDSISKVEVDTGSGFVDQSLSMTLLDAGAANFQAQTLSLGSAITGVDSIRLTLVNADTAVTGFDEVAFSSFSSTVPEPSSLLLMALGLVGLGVRRRRRQNDN